MTDLNKLRFRRFVTRSFGIASTLGFAFAASCSAENPEKVGSNQSALSANIVIAEVYGGGGNTGAQYTNDFVLLFNRGSAAASLNGMSLQYAAAGTNFNAATAANIVALPNASIPAGGYFLVQLAAGAGTPAPLPTPDATGAIALSGTNGKVALVTALLDGCGTTGNLCSTTNIVDFVGYGTAQQSETAPTPVLSNTTSAHRKGGGCVETDDNSADFETGAPTPKNSATAPAVCGASDSGTPDTGAGGTDSGTGGAPADSGPDTGPVDAGPPPVGLVLAELYGGAGNNAPFQNDYVVIFNRGTAAASLANVYVEYGAAAGNFGSQAFNIIALPATTLAVGQYFLVGLGAASFDAGSPAPLPTPDVTGTSNLSSTAGKVGLFHGGAPVTGCGATTPCTGPGVLDIVGYGSTATQFEGSAAAPPPASFSDAVIRKQGGCTDTDDNANDFLSAAAGPKNTSSPINDCSALPDTGTGGAAGGGGTAGSGGTAGAATGGTAGAATGGTAGAATGGTAGAATGGSGGATGGTGGGITGGTGGANPDGGGGIGNVGGFAGKKGGGSEDDGGCGCETPGNAQNSSGLSLLALLGLAALARRRRS